jgi:hypothetical protein
MRKFPISHQDCALTQKVVEWFARDERIDKFTLKRLSGGT